MVALSVPMSRLGKATAEKIRRRLLSSGLEQVLVEQALDRIDQRGDSEHRYPELWATRVGLGYRQGGEPLSDRGGSGLKGSLGGVTESTDTGVRIRLTTNERYALFHQSGFTTSGPNFIPLTRKAARDHRPGGNPREEGLEYGVDYVMAWKGVTVPQRKIFNMPPENRRDLADAVVAALRS